MTIKLRRWYRLFRSFKLNDVVISGKTNYLTGEKSRYRYYQKGLLMRVQTIHLCKNAISLTIYTEHKQTTIEIATLRIELDPNGLPTQDKATYESEAT